MYKLPVFPASAKLFKTPINEKAENIKIILNINYYTIYIINIIHIYRYIYILPVFPASAKLFKTPINEKAEKESSPDVNSYHLY